MSEPSSVLIQRTASGVLSPLFGTPTTNQSGPSFNIFQNQSTGDAFITLNALNPTPLVTNLSYATWMEQISAGSSPANAVWAWIYASTAYAAQTIAYLNTTGMVVLGNLSTSFLNVATQATTIAHFANTQVTQNQAHILFDGTGPYLDLQIAGTTKYSIFIGGAPAHPTFTIYDYINSKIKMQIDAINENVVFPNGNVGIGTTSPKTSLSVSGGFSVGVVTTTNTSYTATGSNYLILADATTTAFTVTLPPATNVGQFLSVIKIDNSVNAVTVNRAGTDTIQGANTLSLALQYDKANLIADGGSKWMDLGKGLV